LCPFQEWGWSQEKGLAHGRKRAGITDVFDDRGALKLLLLGGAELILGGDVGNNKGMKKAVRRAKRS